MTNSATFKDDMGFRGLVIAGDHVISKSLNDNPLLLIQLLNTFHPHFHTLHPIILVDLC